MTDSQRAAGCPSAALPSALRSHLTQWRIIGAGSTVLSWIRDGVRIPFGPSGPPPPFNHGISTVPAAYQTWLDTELHRMLTAGIWERAPDYGPTQCFISRIFLVVKPDKLRLCFDLRHLNSFVVPAPCRYEGLPHLQHLARRDDWMFSFDLKDGFYHIPIAPEHRRFFTFDLQGTRFQFTTLCFGWNRSPWTFTKVMRVVVKHLRSRGLRLLPYVDDFLVLSPSRSHALRARQLVDATLQRLGLRRNEAKSIWEPTQHINHLGLTIDTRRALFLVPPSRLHAIRSEARRLLGRARLHRRWLPKRALARFCGLCLSTTLAVPPARLFTRALYTAISSRHLWNIDVRLSQQALTDLRWWADFDSRWNGRAIWIPPTTQTLHTDASGSTGWGGVLNRQVPAHGFWRPQQRPHHITWKELVAVRLSLQSFLRQLAGRSVHLWSDNTAVVRIVTTGSSRSLDLMQELRKLWQFCAEHDIRLKADYVRTAINIADPWSRITDKTDWKLNPTHFARAAHRWGTPTVDRFATSNNAQVLRYNSLHADPQSEAQDAFTQDWSADHNWLNPPWDLLPEVVRKLQSEPAARATVVAPVWPSQQWYHGLQALASDSFQLPPARDVFFPGRTGSCEPWGNPHWRVALFHVPPRA